MEKRLKKKLSKVCKDLINPALTGVAIAVIIDGDVLRVKYTHHTGRVLPMMDLNLADGWGELTNLAIAVNVVGRVIDTLPIHPKASETFMVQVMSQCIVIAEAKGNTPQINLGLVNVTNTKHNDVFDDLIVYINRKYGGIVEKVTETDRYVVDEVKDKGEWLLKVNGDPTITFDHIDDAALELVAVVNTMVNAIMNPSNPKYGIVVTVLKKANIAIVDGDLLVDGDRYNATYEDVIDLFLVYCITNNDATNGKTHIENLELFCNSDILVESLKDRRK